MCESDCLRYLLLVPFLGVLLGIGVFGGGAAQAQVVDFEGGAVPPDWTEPTGSDASWSITDTTSASGTYSIGSGTVGDSEISEIEVQVGVPKDSMVVFDYRISSEDGFDKLRFYIDGTQRFETSGDSAWASSGEISVSAGTHTFRWAYEKDGSVSRNADKAWIDNVVLPAGTVPPRTAVAQAAGVSDVQLEWKEGAAPDGIEKYKVYRGTAPIDSSAGPSSFTAVDSVGGSETRYLDTGTSVGTTYHYRVTTVDSTGEESGFSGETSVTPDYAATAVEPESGPPGTTLRVYGKGFDPTASNNSVSFIDTTGTPTTATVTAAQPSVLTVEVPSISPSTRRIEVETGAETDTVDTAVQVLAEDAGTRTFSGAALTSSASASASAWADYDNDGVLEVVVAGGGSTTFYENTGSGNFSPLALTGVSGGAAVAWGDYDGDNDSDLVVTGDTTATVYENTGSGLSSISTGLEGVLLSAAAWGDYDNDGDLDLVVTGRNSGGDPSTTLYRNDGSGTFTSVSAGLPDVENGDVAWGDYNDDGLVDLAVAGQGTSSTTTQILRNEGNGTFTSVGADLTGTNSGSVDWVDYNGDDALDLLVTGNEGGTTASTTLYRNDGGGSFTPVGAGFTNVRSSDADWGDYDGDGDPDLVLTGQTGSDTTAVLYRNDGFGSFTPIDTGLTGVTNGSVDWGDQNGDGVLDLILTGEDGNTNPARVYESTSAPPPPPTGLDASGRSDRVRLSWEAVGASDVAEYRLYRDTAPIDSTTGVGSATALDTVAAGTTTYADGSVGTGNTYYYRVTAADDMGSESGASTQAQGTTGFRLSGFEPVSGTPTTAVQVFGNGFSSSSNTVSFVDTTGNERSATINGTQDRVLTVEVPSGLDAPARIVVERSDGLSDTTAARFTPIGQDIGDRSFTDTATSFVGAEESDAAWADYDGDGDLDVVITGDGPTTTLYRNDDSTFVSVGAGLTDVGNSDAAWADYDNDGDPDLALMGGGAGPVVTEVYENKGGGTFEPVGLGLTGIENGGIDWADFNGDGRPDLAVTGQNGNDFSATTRIYRNDDDTTFTAVDAGVVGAEDAELQWGDYDADGDPDLAVMGTDPTSSGNQTTIYRNDGGGAFTDIQAGLPGLIDGDLDWGDYDNDGDLDLAVVGEGSGSNVTTIYENEGSDSFSALGAGLVGVGNESALDWGDYDGDGRPDLVVIGEDESLNRRTILYRNQGGGSFAAVDKGIGNVSRGSVDLVDYESDGALDLLVTGEIPTGTESTTSVALLYQSRPEPPAPTAVRTRLAEDQQIQIQWEASQATDISRYRVYRATTSIAGGASSLTPIDSVEAPATSYTDTSTAAETTYYYRLTALDTTRAESAFSPEAVATPKPAAGTLYVDQSAGGANDGSSWDDAFEHLQDAADSVNANPYTDYDVRVAEGVYYPDEDMDGDHVSDDTTESFRIQVDDVSLLGGYPSGGGTRDPGANVTVLSGDITQDDSTTSTGVTGIPSGINGPNANTVLHLDGTEIQDSGASSEALRSGTVIDGVTITGGEGGTGSTEDQAAAQSNGGGMLCTGYGADGACSPIVRRVTIRGNVAPSGGGAAVMGRSGGVTRPTFQNTTFRANLARTGGGVYVSSRFGGTAAPVFERSLFRGNRATSFGGGTYAFGQSGEEVSRVAPYFVNSEFRGNRASATGGGFFGISGGAAGRAASVHVNTLYYQNQAGDNGGAFGFEGQNGSTTAPALVNVTAVRNRANQLGGAAYIRNDLEEATVTPRFRNSVLWENKAGTGSKEVANNSGSPSFSHSLVEESGGSGSGWDGALGADDGGNIDRDPLLVDTSAVDVRPQEDSPVLDAGLNSALPADSTDLDADADSTETLPLDLADSTRVVDNDGDGTATVNMGAYEAVGPDLTPLAAPDTAVATAFTDSLRVEWTPVAEGDLVRYRIYRDTTAIDTTAGPGSVVPFDSVTAGTTTYTDTAIAADSTYYYRITSVDESGNESGFSAEARARPAAALTVWPGDTDNDGTVNQNDVLPLGFQWGQTGPARDSTGCGFEKQEAPAWPTQAATYADANGDGTVDQNDVLCIGLNWGDSTSTSKARPLYATSATRKSRSSSAAPAGQPSLGQKEAKQGAPSGRGRFELDAPTTPDSVLWVNVRAKDMKHLAGVAFEVTYPQSKASVEAVERHDWFGEDALLQSQVDDESGVVGVGLVHPDSVRSGSGTVVRLKVRLSDATTDAVPLRLQNVRAGRAAGMMSSPEVGTGVDVRRVPERFELHGNFPNPVRRSTEIRYDLPSERHVELRVYDVLGRHVATLIDDTQKPGQKKVAWRADRMASGVYVYRLRAGEESETGKMTVVR